MVEIQKIGDPVTDDSRAQQTRPRGLLPDGDGLFGDVNDLIDNHAHAVVAIVEDNHLQRVGFDGLREPGFKDRAQRRQRKNAIAVLDDQAAASPFDQFRREFFESRDQGERNGHPFKRTRPEQKQPLLFRFRDNFLVRGGPRLVARLDENAGLLSDPDDVEDQGYAPIAHDCGSRIDGQPFQLFSQRFDDNLLRIVDAVDNQTELTVLRLQDHDIDRFPADPAVFVSGRLQPQDLVQGRNRQETPATAKTGVP